MDTDLNIPNRLIRRFHYAYLGFQNRFRVLRAARRVASLASPSEDKKPVVFFNATARLQGLNLNSAFSLLTAWGLRLAGWPVIHYVCNAGLTRCVLGTDRDDHTASPPCASCTAQSRRLYAHADTRWFTYTKNDALAASLRNLDLESLSEFEYQGLSYGETVLPSLRWALRRHHLIDDEPTRFLLRQYILSAHNLAMEFSAFLDQVDPLAVIVFNGTLYPEAVVRQVSQQRGIRVITHEVAFQPFSAFFTDGQATAYPIDIPEDFELSPKQNARLDTYLEHRFQGQFTMAGIRFWPEMRGLDEGLLAKVEKFGKLVPVFTNVIFDTSQVHANTIFPHMFAWLDAVLESMRSHPETLFVIRAHPDEMRPGKRNRQSVRAWVDSNRVAELQNVVFIKSREYTSSYALIQRAKFVMVYNSSIGLEASLMGVPVLCAGRARYTQYPTVFFPDTSQTYLSLTEEFLAAEDIHLPEEFLRQARRYLYYQLYRASLPFGEFLQSHPRPGYVSLKSFPVENLLPQNSPALQVLEEGVVNSAPFLV
jgi:hypothetical protein